MKKRLLSLFLAWAVCLSMLPTVAWAAGGHEHEGVSYRALTCEDGRLLCGGGEILPEQYNGVGTHSGSAYALSAGNYYLGGDIALDAPICVPSGTVNLCLNGHSFTVNGKSLAEDDADTVIYESENNAAFTLEDCQAVKAATDHTYENMAFEKWTGQTSLPDTAGEYYLEDNVTLSEMWKPVGTTMLDLHGHSITAEFAGTAITIEGNANFTLYDCAADGTSGSITHAATYSGSGVTVENGSIFTMNGGKIAGNLVEGKGGGVYNTGTFIMNGGSITGNQASGAQGYGGGVYNGGNLSKKGTFTMSGGEIIGNRAAWGGGVYTSNVLSVPLTVSGNVKIINNTEIDSATASNVYLPENPIVIGANGLDTNARIGVTAKKTPTTEQSIAVASGARNGYTADNITSDNSEYSVQQAENEVVLLPKNGMVKHTHADGSKFVHVLTSDADNRLKIDGQNAGNTVYTDAGTNKQAQGYIIPDGTYYLDADVTVNQVLLIKSGAAVKICLNDHTLTGNNEEPIFIVYGNAALEIDDCGTQGTITGGSNLELNGFGGAVFNNGTFVLHNGKISGNKSVFGGAICNSGGATVKLLGGSIENNTTKAKSVGNAATNNSFSGGAVYNAGKLELSGNVKFANNTDSSGHAATGIMLEGNAKITIIGELTGDTPIGVSKYNNSSSAPALIGGDFATGWNTYMSGKSPNQYFTSDNTAYQVSQNGDTLRLADPSVSVHNAHPICGATCSDGEHNAVEWTGVSSLSEITSAGYYYLKNDVQISSTWEPESGVVLCLNGKKIEETIAVDAIIINYKKFTLCDCQGGGIITHSTNKTGRGVHAKYGNGIFTMYGGNITGNKLTEADAAGGGVRIYGGTFNMYGGSITNNTASGNGGGVDIGPENEFHMHGGIISGNTSKNRGGGVALSYGDKFYMTDGAITQNSALEGGGVYMPGKFGDKKNCSFTMTGGTITENSATSVLGNGGGGVYVEDGTLTVGGTAKITNNTKKLSTIQNTENNVYLPADHKIAIDADSKLSTDASIGVTTAVEPDTDRPVAFVTNATVDDVSHFSSDKGSYYVVYKEADNQLYLSTTSHIKHTWQYAANENVITATCSECNADGGSITISAPTGTLTYDGTTKPATVNGLIEGVTTPTISYTKNGNSVNEPIDAGTYIASITVGNATASVKYDIAKAKLNADDFNFTAPSRLVYDGTAKEANVTAKQNIQGSGAVAIKYYNENDVQVSPVNVGIYTVKIDVTAGSNYQTATDLTDSGWTFEIAKATASLTGKPQAKTSLEYNGTAQELVTADNVTVTGGKLVYSTEKDGTYSETIPTGTDAGNYTVWYKVQGNGSYSDTTPAKVEAVIQARSVTVSGITADEKVYDGTVDAALNVTNATFNGKLDKDNLTVIASGVFEDKNVGSNKTVKITSLTIDGADKKNYTLDTVNSQQTTDAAITTRPLTITSASAVNRYYIKDNTSVEADVIFGNAIDTLVKGTDYTVTGMMENDIAGSSDKKVTVQVTLKNANYSLANNIFNTTVTISKLEMPIFRAALITQKWSDTIEKEMLPQWSGLPDDMGKHTFSATIQSIPNGVSMGGWSMDTDTGKIRYVLTGATEVNVNDKIVLKVLITSENYADATTELTINIVDRDPQTGFKFAELTQTKTYGDAKFTVTATDAAKGSTITYSSDHPEIAAVDADTGEVTIKGAGTAVITATAAETSDYAEAKATYTLTVNKKPLTITVKSKSAYVNDAVPATEYEVSGLLEGEHLTTEPTVKYVDAAGNAITPDMTTTGETVIRASGAAAANYEITYVDGKLTVSRRSGGSSGGSSSGGSFSGTKYMVTLPSKTTGGTVKSSTSSAASGSTVTITVTPDEGYKVDKVSVSDSKGNQLKVTDKGGNKYSFTMPSGKVTVTPTFSKIAQEPENSPFADVSASDYYCDAVKWAAGKGITGGVSSDRFAPADGCTRAQIVTFMWRAAGSPEPKTLSTFTDVPADAYYAKAVAWAVENGITIGTTATTFSPDDICTRAHGVTFLYRAAKASAASGSTAFTDVDENAYYAKPVKWAVDNGITTGVTSELFAPNNRCTRAQIVTFLYRLYGSK